jgi:thiol-disulfide isomerase/thioredoxin
MLKFLPLMFALACNACGPAELKTSVDTAPEVPEDPYPWATWETCAHNLGDNPCNFSLMDQNGAQVELYELYGKVIILDFSVMWCGPCNSIAPLADQYLELYGEDNFVWVTILVEDQTGSTVELSDLQTWATTHNTVAPILAGSRDLIDVTEPLEDGYPITAWPTMVVIDRTMKIHAGMNGFNQSAIESWVSSLL